MNVPLAAREESGTGSMLIEGPILAASEAKMADAPALIGPNAILQALPVMERVLGTEESAKVLREARICALPTGETMIPEIDAMRLHHALSMRDPFDAIEIAREAGVGTADYIIANRIPRAAVRLLRWLPAKLAAPLLMKAIAKHAWTFIGSGHFAPKGGWHFTIDRTHADDLMMPTDSLFEWYAAVFSRLYQEMVHADAVCHDEGPAPMRRFAHQYRIEVRLKMGA